MSDHINNTDTDMEIRKSFPNLIAVTFLWPNVNKVESIANLFFIRYIHQKVL